MRIFDSLRDRPEQLLNISLNDKKIRLGQSSLVIYQLRSCKDLKIKLFGKNISGTGQFTVELYSKNLVIYSEKMSFLNSVISEKSITLDGEYKELSLKFSRDKKEIGRIEISRIVIDSTIDDNLLQLKKSSLNKEGEIIYQPIFDTSFADEEQIDLNTYFDKIYCLNLDSRVDRWSMVSERFSELNINATRFSASSKDDLDVQEEYEKVLKIYRDKNNKNYRMYIGSVGAMGCLISHIKMIQDAKDNGYKRILIFEDDVIFHKKFNNYINNIKRIPEWKLLYLGSSQYSWNTININKAIFDGFYSAKSSYGTFAYALHESLYDVCLNMFSALTEPVDSYLSYIQSKIDTAYVMFPNLVIADVSESDIRGPRNQKQQCLKLKWNFNDYKI